MCIRDSQNVAPSHLADTALFDFARLGARNSGVAPEWLPGRGCDEVEEGDEDVLPPVMTNLPPAEVRVPLPKMRQV